MDRGGSRLREPTDAELQDAYTRWRRDGDRGAWGVLLEFVMARLEGLQSRERDTPSVVWERLQDRLFGLQEHPDGGPAALLFEVWLTAQKWEAHRQRSVAQHLRLQLGWLRDRLRRDYCNEDKPDSLQCSVSRLATTRGPRWLLAGSVTRGSHVGAVFGGELPGLRWLAVRRLGELPGCVGSAAEGGGNGPAEPAEPLSLEALGEEPALWYGGDLLALPWVPAPDVRSAFLDALMAGQGRGRCLRVAAASLEASELAAQHLAPVGLDPATAIEAAAASRYTGTRRQEVVETDLEGAETGRATALSLLADEAADPARLVTEAEFGQALADCRRRLPSDQQLLLEMRFEWELTWVEIAGRCGLSPYAMNRRKNAVLKALRRCLAEKHYESGETDDR